MRTQNATRNGRHSKPTPAWKVAQSSTSEFRFQVSVKKLLERTAPSNVIWFHVPNGEKRSRRTGGKLKKMGVRRGVPDFAFVLPSGQAAFLELKTDDGTPSQEQNDFADSCARIGAPYAVARSIDDAISILSAWGAIKVV